MRCPFCGSTDNKVVDSRPTDDKAAIRRRRECNECLNRFTTYEKVEEMPMLVIKKDGRRTRFDRDKLIFGIMKACEKRPVSRKMMDDMVTRIENKIGQNPEMEIASQKIGEMVMDELKDIDQVAYVRFASVYREFKDINTFMDELNKLLKENVRGQSI